MKSGDIKAIEAVKAGDEQALRDLFDELLPFVRAVIRHELDLQGIPATHYSVEDIAHDVIIRIYSNLDKFNPLSGKFENWCAVIASNSTRSVARRIRREITSEIEPEMVPLWSSEPDPAKILQETKFIEKLMMNLGSEEAEIVLLRLEGLSFDEIAKRRTDSQSRTRSTYARAIKKLKKLLESGRENLGEEARQ